MKRVDQARRQSLAQNDSGNGTPAGDRARPLQAVPNEVEVSIQTAQMKIGITSDQDIVKARQEGRRIAADAGFSVTDLVLVATAISELARNIVRYARKGEIVIRQIHNSGRRGIEIMARDEGPGIKNIEQVLQVGFSTSSGLGLGLPGVRRLMDEFDIQSKVGSGTTVTAKKWKN